MELEGGAGHKERESHQLERNPSSGEETGRRGTRSLYFSLRVARPWAATAEPAGEDSHHSAPLAFAQDLVTGEGLGLSPSGRGCVLCVETDGGGCVGGHR